MRKDKNEKYKNTKNIQKYKSKSTPTKIRVHKYNYNTTKKTNTRYTHKIQILRLNQI